MQNLRELDIGLEDIICIYFWRYEIFVTFNFGDRYSHNLIPTYAKDFRRANRI